jgi:hypothetical protein
MARTRKLLEALGEVEPRRYKRLSNHRSKFILQGEPVVAPTFPVEDIIQWQPMAVPTTLLFHMSLEIGHVDVVPEQTAVQLAVQLQNNIDQKILEALLEELKLQEDITDGTSKGC